MRFDRIFAWREALANFRETAQSCWEIIRGDMWRDVYEGYNYMISQTAAFDRNHAMLLDNFARPHRESCHSKRDARALSDSLIKHGWHCRHPSCNIGGVHSCGRHDVLYIGIPRDGGKHRCKNEALNMQVYGHALFCAASLIREKDVLIRSHPNEDIELICPACDIVMYGFAPVKLGIVHASQLTPGAAWR